MKRFILILFCILIGYFAVDIYYSNNVLQAEHITVTKSDLPKSFDGFKIVHLSDTHAKNFGENNHKMLLLIEKEKPDIIVITGDYIDSPNDLEYATTFAAELVKLAPTYYTTGNHEWGGKVAKTLMDELRFTGVHVVDNTFEIIEKNGDKITISGQQDPNGLASQKTLFETMEIAKEQQSFNILLCHRYDMFDEYVNNDVDLVFSGHAHGGLIRLPFTDGIIGPGKDFFPKNTSGVVQENNTVMIVSRGIGDADSGFRMFNRPHIPIVTLK